MKRFFVLFLILINTTLVAQTRFENLAQCLEYVKAHNPSLRSEALNEEMVESRMRSAWAPLLPQVRAFGSFDNNISLPVQLVPAQFLGGPEGQFAEVQFGTRYTSSYGVEASISLVNISSWRNISTSTLAHQASTYQFEDKQLSLLEQAATVYYLALLGYEAVTISTQLVSSADSLLKAAEIRHANGMIEPMEFNRVKALHLESLQQLTAQQAALEKNINTLKYISGIDIGDTLIFSGNISQVLPISSNTESEIISTRLPRHRMLHYRTLQASEELKRQRSKVFPEVSLFGRYTRQAFSNDTDMFTSAQPWYEVGVAGLRAEWNLFTGFSRQSSIRQASLQAEIAQEDLKQFTLQSDREIQELRVNHVVASEAVTRYKAHYELNQENYRIAGKKYIEGVYTIDQYIVIYQELVRSQNQYLANLANYLIYESIIKGRNALK